MNPLPVFIIRTNTSYKLEAIEAPELFGCNKGSFELCISWARVWWVFFPFFSESASSHRLGFGGLMIDKKRYNIVLRVL
jgi:hypothetical protein